MEQATDVLHFLTMGTLGVATATVLAYLLRATRLLERVVALEVLAALTVSIAAFFTIMTDVTTTIDVALAIALISFTGTIAFASFAESRSDDV